jgi:membrane-associated phospholipid phosphatase
MASPESRSSQPGWSRQCAIRLTLFWPVKMIGTTLGMTLFFALYFWVLRHPSVPPIVMPLTAVDRWIVFCPAALPLYLSLWLYVSLVPGLLSDRRDLIGCGIAAAALSAIGLGIFYFWPTAVPTTGAEWSPESGFAFLKTVDASGNACPSLHVAFAVFSAVWISRMLNQTGAGPLPRALNWLWCVGIMYSTIAIRQHVALDVVAGMILGAVVAAVPWRRIVV